MCSSLRLFLAVALSTSLGWTQSPAAPALDAQAVAVIRSLDEAALARTPTLVVAEDTMDVVEPDGHVVQYSHRRTLWIQRPDRLHIVSQGDLTRREFLKDGDRVTIVDHGEKVYGEIESPGTIADTMTLLIERYGMSVPLGDFFAASPAEVLLGDAQSARYLGLHRVGLGVCHHISIQYPDIDAQVWIEQGSDPSVSKLVLRYKNEPGVPQYTLRVISRSPLPDGAAGALTIDVPAEYERVDIEPLAAEEQGR